MNGNLPDFLIIGAMKAATSTLHMQLAAQPGIFMATPKEPNFFSDADQWARGLEWYRGLFADADFGDLLGEASTHYTKLPTFPDTLARLRATVPNPKLIYVMRHPVDRLMSHYHHGWLEHTINGPIDEAIGCHPELIDYSRYAMQITPWLTAFGKEAILPVFSQRLAVEPQDELERICRFIDYRGVPQWSARLSRENVSRHRLRESPLRDNIIDHPLLAMLRRRIIPKAFRNSVKRLWQMREAPIMSDATRTQITAIFDKDLVELGGLLGVQLDCANFDRIVEAQALDWS